MSSTRSCGSPGTGFEPTTRFIHSMFSCMRATTARHSCGGVALRVGQRMALVARQAERLARRPVDLRIALRGRAASARAARDRRRSPRCPRRPAPSTPAIISAISLPRLPLPSMRSTMRCTTAATSPRRASPGSAGCGTARNSATSSSAPRERGSGSCCSSNVGRQDALEHRPVRARFPALPGLRDLIGPHRVCQQQQDSQNAHGYSVWERSPRENPRSGVFTPRPTASTLNSSPISAGDSSLLRFGGDRRVVQRVVGVRLREHLGDAAVDQELRLGGIAEHVEAGLARRVSQRAEIHVRGDVLLARMQERIAVRAVAVVAHERAHRALRVVVLVAREAVVDDEDRAALEVARRDERIQPRAASPSSLSYGTGTSMALAWLSRPPRLQAGLPTSNPRRHRVP